MNKITVLLVLVVRFNFLIAQTYEKIYQSNLDDLVYDAVLVDTTYCIFAINSGDNSTGEYSSKFFKMDILTGNFTDTLIIEPKIPGYYFAGIFDVLKLSDSYIVGIGSFGMYNSSAQNLYVVHVDNNLTKTFETIINIPGIEEVFRKTIITKDSILVSVGNKIQSFDRIICETTLFGDSVRYNTFNHYGSFTASTVLCLPHKNKYHMYIAMGTEKAIDLIDKTTLERDTMLAYPSSFLPKDAVHDDTDSSIYYVAGTMGYPYFPHDNLCYLKFNDEGEILNEYSFNLTNIAYYTYKCFSPSKDHIYFGGVYPCTSGINSPESRYILTYKLAKDGSILWQKFFKGEVNYMVYKIISTYDGGALLFSTKYNWNDPTPDQRDVHILKVDSTGYYDPLTQTPEWAYQVQKQILLYPNPVEKELNIATGFYNNLQINIYNSTGEKEIFIEVPYSIKIDVSTLAPGIYFYLIIGQNGFKESGKIVKK